MNTKQINELRKLADAATPGPWEYDYDDQDHDTCIGILWGTNHYAIATIPYNGQVSDEKVTATGNYIAAANPAAILALIAEIDSLRDQVNGLTGSLDRAETVLQNLMSYLSVNGSWADVSPCEAEQRIRDGIDILVRPAVPAEWREVMAELAADLQSTCDAEHPHRDQYPSVMRKYNNDMKIVEKARALLQSAEAAK